MRERERGGALWGVTSLRHLRKGGPGGGGEEGLVAGWVRWKGKSRTSKLQSPDGSAVYIIGDFEQIFFFFLVVGEGARLFG